MSSKSETQQRLIAVIAGAFVMGLARAGAQLLGVPALNLLTAKHTRNLELAQTKKNKCKPGSNIN